MKVWWFYQFEAKTLTDKSIFWHILNKKDWNVLDVKVQINKNVVVKARFYTFKVLNGDVMITTVSPLHT